MDAISLLLVDPQRCIRQAVYYKLAQEPDLLIVGETDSLAQLPKLMKNTTPQITLIDVTLLDQPGQMLCRKILTADPHTVFIAFSPFDWDVYLAAAWQAGASAFIVKTCTIPELLQTVRMVAGVDQA
ncbi:MAG: response regulator [Caldilineaceae bacterium]